MRSLRFVIPSAALVVALATLSVVHSASAGDPKSAAIASEGEACDHSLPAALEAKARRDGKLADRALMPADKKHEKAGTLKDGEKAGCPYAKRAMDKIRELEGLKGSVRHYGGSFGLLGFVDFADLVANHETFTGKTVKVDTRIQSVCRKKGCWMVIGDGAAGKTVRVTMKDYGFFVPTDADGKRAIVEGVFVRKVLSEAQRRHYAQDAGRDPSGIHGDEVELTMVANAIDLLD